MYNDGQLVVGPGQIRKKRNRGRSKSSKSIHIAYRLDVVARRLGKAPADFHDHMREQIFADRRPIRSITLAPESQWLDPPPPA
jgi:hypothetical protein